MAQTYKNIPVKPEIYAKVKLLADANNRGMGDQVSAWVEREIPECDHQKQPVSIETFPSGDFLINERNKGWFCPICNRVYHYQKLLTVAVTKKQISAAA